jgi:SsrA-binding protein
VSPSRQPKTAPRAERVEKPVRVIARNPRARHDYEILDTYEAGIVLHGTEVKALRDGNASLIGAFGRVTKGEVFLEGLNIAPYEKGNRHNKDPLRSRKLLLHTREIRRLIGAVEQKGHTLVPLELYFKGSRAKVAIALGRGKKQHDRREDLRKRDAEREMARAVRRR